MEVVQMKYHPKEVYYEHRNGVSYIVLVYGDSKVEHVISAQQNVQRIGGTCPAHNAPLVDMVRFACGCFTTTPANR